MEHKTLIDELYFCAAQCTRCYDACMLEKENNNLQRCMMFDQDCAEVCRLTGQFLERNSDNQDLLLKLCEEICERCAEECERHDDLEHCRECATACRNCIEACRKHMSVH